MDSKIDWYKEVLALEPGSKLFFPLAKLLAENGDYLEALGTLRNGLEKHPEYMEAQFFLVEVLSNLGREDEAQEIAAGLAETISAYPAYWQEWARLFALREQDRDAALALNFLAASFNGNPIGWGEIIERGLLALLADDDSQASRGIRAHMNETMERVAAKVSTNELLERDKAKAPAASGKTAPVRRDEDNGKLDYRTRSMAELLAQQGDFQGAADIYKELVAAAPEGAGRVELNARLRELLAQAGQSAPENEGEGATSEPEATAESPAEGAAEEQPKQGKKRLIHTLEALAQRLEARAAS